jgi:hypothetical protein
MVNESFYAIRRTDGEPLFGDYGWIRCESPEDWSSAVDEASCTEKGQAVECEIVLMTVTPIARRSFQGTE